MSAGVLFFSIMKDYSTVLNKHQRLINIFAFLAFSLFIGLMFTKESLDAYSIVLIPAMLSGLLIDDSWMEKFYNVCPTQIFPSIGRLSLEIYLVHSPMIHIVHSSFKLLNLPLIPWILTIADVIVVIIAAVLLHKICNAPRLAHHRAQ